MAEARRATSPGGVIEGQWMRLAPVGAYTQEAMEDLQFRLGLRPEMVSPGLAGAPAGSRFGEAAVIASLASGEMLGILGNVELGDYPGVAALVIYVDEERARAGLAMEAWYRYVARIFELGATKVQMEVLSFNTPVHRIMRKIGARPEVVLREHFYIAGRHWDATLYGFDRQQWEAVADRYRGVVNRPATLASPRQDQAEAPTSQEAKSMNVDYLILTDAAIAAEGKHYLHGAGWDTIVAPSFPAFHRHIGAALRLRLPAGGQSQRLGVDVVDPAGASLLSAPSYSDLVPGTATPADPGGDQSMALVFNFDGLHFTAPGTYAVVVSLDAREIHRAVFHVRAAG